MWPRLTGTRARRSTSAGNRPTNRPRLERLEDRIVLDGTLPGLFAFDSPGQYAVGQTPLAVVVGDVTGDGHADVATANAASNSVSVLPGKGDGTFGSAIDLSVAGAPDAIAVGDFDRDGLIDVVS